MKGKKAHAKPGVVLLKDLVPRKAIKGGTGKLVFGQQSEPRLDADRPPRHDATTRPGKSKAAE